MPGDLLPQDDLEKRGPYYPGGEDAAIYRYVFGLFVVLFLGVICIGLLNFLGMFVKKTT